MHAKAGVRERTHGALHAPVLLPRIRDGDQPAACDRAHTLARAHTHGARHPPPHKQVLANDQLAAFESLPRLLDTIQGLGFEAEAHFGDDDGEA